MRVRPNETTIALTLRTLTLAPVNSIVVSLDVSRTRVPDGSWLRASPLFVFFVFCKASLAWSAEAPVIEPDKTSQMPRFLQEAREMIDHKKPGDGIQKCDQVIRAFETYYSNKTCKIYCTRTKEEELLYLLTAAADKTNAIALSSTWADAYFMKGYAQLELGRISEAKSSLQSALLLSPQNSQYLSEMGHVHQLEKDWTKAKELFIAAEENIKLGPDKFQSQELGRARRGLGYVMVEQGKLDEAEKKYLECLKSDPQDTVAKRELEYVRSLKAKKKK